MTGSHGSRQGKKCLKRAVIGHKKDKKGREKAGKE